MARRMPVRYAIPPLPALRICTTTVTSLAVIVCLASWQRALTAQEKPDTAPSVEQQRSQTAMIAPAPGSTPAAFELVRPAEVRRWPVAAEDLTGIAQPAPRGSSRDSLKNGAVLGAVIGAAGLGAVGALICNLYQEEGGASCLPDALRGAAIGAAIGIGAGVAVDAAVSRHAGVAVRIRVTF